MAAFALLAIPPLGASPKTKVNPKEQLKGNETIGDIATVFRDGKTNIEGVGLVSGLAETGGDAQGSAYRTALVEEMRKRGLDNANTLLAKNKSLALVVV